MSKNQIDAKNIAFWDELCGTSLARALGIIDNSPESLERFDMYYFGMYPYLKNYVLEENLEGLKVLEIGLGYGSLSQFLASKNCLYQAVDIAIGPVKIVKHRLNLIGIPDPEKHVVQASALSLPYADGYFDCVYSIGTLHHTGNLRQCINEVHRVLRVEGKALIMIYNSLSFRQVVVLPLQYLKSRKNGSKKTYGEFVRAYYDGNSMGDANPYTDFISPIQTKKIFGDFSKVKIDIQNFDSYQIFNKYFDRKIFLNNIGRVLGLDQYVKATK